MAIPSKAMKTPIGPVDFIASAPPMTGPNAEIPLQVDNIGPSMPPRSDTTATSATIP